MRLLYLVSHPIQHQVPLLRLIAGQPDIALMVLFEHVDTTSTYWLKRYFDAVTFAAKAARPLCDLQKKPLIS